MLHPLEDALLRGDDLCINLAFQNGNVDVSVQLDGEPLYEAMDFQSVDDALSAISEFVRNDYHMRKE